MCIPTILRGKIPFRMHFYVTARYEYEECSEKYQALKVSVHYDF